MSTTYKIKCAKCKVPVESPVETEAETTVSCPVCGTSDTLENALHAAMDACIAMTWGCHPGHHS